MIASALLAALLVGPTAHSASADEADAKSILKAMSNYITAQTSIAFDYDSTFDVVTEEGQTLGIAASGKVVLERPDKVMATRIGGFTNVEILSDGKKATLVGNDASVYAGIDNPGSIDDLIEALHDTYGFPLPGADLLGSDLYHALMDGVTNVKDLGAGVIGGTTCNHLAFRSEAVDWQIYIAEGDAPRPCRYVIASKDIDGAPRYQIELTDWTTGAAVPEVSFAFEDSEGARKVDVEELRAVAGEFPPQFTFGAK